MKKVLVLLAMVLGITNMYAQNYDLEGLAKACSESETVYSFHEGLAKICKDGKYGFMDKTGKIVIPTIYRQAIDFHEGLAAVKKDEKYGYIDKEGNVVLPFRFDDADYFMGGYARVHEGPDSVADSGQDYNYLIDKMGIPIQEDSYNIEGNYSDGLIRVRSIDTDKYGFANAKGQIVIPFLYDSAFDFKEGVARVSKNGKDEFIDKSGRTVLPFRDKVGYSYTCSEGLIYFQKEIRSLYFFGFMNKQGYVAIPPIYGNVRDFHDGLAWVQWDSWEGFIDTNGKKVLECKYCPESGFNEGMAVIEKNDKYGYINRAGQIIAPFSFDEANDFSEGLGLVKKGRRYGYIDKRGNSTFDFSIVQQSIKEEEENDSIDEVIDEVFDSGD